MIKIENEINKGERMLEVKTIRKATEKELSTPIETIRYFLIESYERRIEKANLKKYGHSMCACSMHLPHGIIDWIQHGGEMVGIHVGWRAILKAQYLR
ncbi:hypothetical protein ES708_30231 [subsurface metagenome]